MEISLRRALVFDLRTCREVEELPGTCCYGSEANYVRFNVDRLENKQQYTLLHMQ
jgi:hypothetical protein